MAENLRLARLYLAMLAIAALGRWLQGVFGVPYEKGHHVFSIVILTLFSCLFYGAFTRRWRGYRPLQAVGLGASFGAISQLVIFALTVLSYALGMNTYFNHPTALNASEAVPFLTAVGSRFGGLIANSILAGIAGALGWAVGGLLPEK